MLSRRVKIIINLVTIIALAILLYVSWPDITKGLQEIGGAKWSIIALMIPLQIFNFFAVGMIYHSYFKGDNQTKITKKDTFKVALELNFVNNVFPSGGVATLFGTLLGVYIISDEKRIKAFTAFLPRIINAIFKPFKKHRKNTIDIHRVERLFGAMHDDYRQLMKEPSRLKMPFFWALAVNTTEVLTIYLAYLALGQVINPGAVILAYSVASFAGLVSVLPGGIGVYEALMTTVLAASGVPKALALSATLIYRIFTMMIFVPTGFILYQLALKKGEAEDLKNVHQPSSDSN